MTSYQRRLRNIIYWRERGEDLERIIHALCKQLCEAGIDPRIPLVGGIMGDRQLNDVGEFGMQLSMHYQKKKQP
jgi:hypothetical protein